jgi:predicted metal-dependent phosphoesterase TrpH
MTPELWSVDLHTHTTYSDGSQSPAELVRLARANGVRVLGVTDHDHTGGIDEALACGAREGVEIVPGIELSVSHAEFEDIHILAYYFAWRAPALSARLAACRMARETRAERILERINAKLAAEGRPPLAYAEVKARVQGAFGRPHIAALLIERGYVPDMNAAFREYLVPCNVAKAYMPAAEALALVRQARGLTSVAHPKFITSDRTRLRQVIRELQALGLDGIEAYHSDHSPDERLYLVRLAEQYGLLVTGGSDYHGFRPPGAQHDGGGKLGSLQLPYGMAVRLRREYLRRYPIAVLLLQWPATAASALQRMWQAHYRLATAATAGQELTAAIARLERAAHALALHVPRVDTALIEALASSAKRGGVPLVAVPWEGLPAGWPASLSRTTAVTPQRWQRTTLERLGHALLHEAILAQVQALNGERPAAVERRP